jgi:hypothetical protein
MVTNEQIRRARPSVDSPLGRLIKGEISPTEYDRQLREKQRREKPEERRQAADSR